VICITHLNCSLTNVELQQLELNVGYAVPSFMHVHNSRPLNLKSHKESVLFRSEIGPSGSENLGQLE
jgi:hypothetical protein